MKRNALDSGRSGAKPVRGNPGGNAFYRWIMKNGRPSDLQCLCFNCNVLKRLNNGVLPEGRDDMMEGDGDGI